MLPSHSLSISLAALCAGALTLGLAPAMAESPVVAVSTVTRGAGIREASFQAELRPYLEIEVHAKVTGYIDALNVDVGDIVKEGQVIATLDVPELKIELEHALADQRRSNAEVERATAAYEDAHLTYTRLTATDKAQPHLLATQDLDTAKAKDHATAATLDAAKEQCNVAEAEAKRLQTMVDYAQITAPFDGVITRRNADPGALIQAGTSAGALPLVRLSQNSKIRVVFPVSLSYVSDIHVGDTVEIHIASLGRTVTGRIARFTRKVETSTRTMEAEVDLPNTDLSLTPGIYAEVVLKAQQKENALFVPVESVLQEASGPSLYVVNGNHLVEERKVKLGLETPSKVEVLSGVRENEMVLVGSRTQVTPGETVSPKQVSAMQVN